MEVTKWRVPVAGLLQGHTKGSEKLLRGARMRLKEVLEESSDREKIVSLPQVPEMMACVPIHRLIYIWDLLESAPR